MYSGFVSKHKSVTRIGIHQRFDIAAYRMIKRYLPDGLFPTINEILHFEGYNGPDGLKVKSRGQNEPSHMYDPVSDTGDAVIHIENHYAGLVSALTENDTVRAAFEAAWMAHYVGDGLTPAHHWPLEEKLEEAATLVPREVKRGNVGKFAALAKKNWEIWGAKGHMTTHFNFELGVAFALLVYPIKPVLSEAELASARSLGPVEYFKTQARDIADMYLYDEFYEHGWTAAIASKVKNKIAPQAARTIGILWLLALLESHQEMALEAVA